MCESVISSTRRWAATALGDMVTASSCSRDDLRPSRTGSLVSSSMNDRYPDNHDAVWARYQRVGLEGLSPEERVVHCVWWLEAEVNNGGFDQFFFNSAGGAVPETLEALEWIGANKTKDLLVDAVRTAFGDTPVPTDLEALVNAWLASRAP